MEHKIIKGGFISESLMKLIIMLCTIIVIIILVLLGISLEYMHDIGYVNGYNDGYNNGTTDAVLITSFGCLATIDRMGCEYNWSRIEDEIWQTSFKGLLESLNQKRIGEFI